jgi:hypothetical protein
MLNFFGLLLRSTGLALLLLLLANPVQAADDSRRSSAANSGLHRQASDPTPPVFQTGTLGLCHLYNLSGYFAIDQTGAVVPLQPYCQDQQNWVWYAEGSFWRAFRRAATTEALTFAQTLDQQAIEAYALSICTLLNDESFTPATAMQTLETVQSGGPLPIAFDQAVTQAAIRTYCPEHRSVGWRTADR